MKKYKKFLGTVLAASLLFAQETVANAESAEAINPLNGRQLYTQMENAQLEPLTSTIIGDEIQAEFSDEVDTVNLANEVTPRRAANKYIWSYSTKPYVFEDQVWSSNREVYSTYPVDSEGFVTAGYLLNPNGQGSYNTALREGYLNDYAYAELGGHYYQVVVSSADYNDVTIMLESNVYVAIFNNDLEMIFESIQQTGDTDYFTRYYSTTKTIQKEQNLVISLGLVTGNYYMVFMPFDTTAEKGYHYGFYAGQPLPILQTSTVSGTMHNATIRWDQRSSSQSATTQSVTITCPSGTASEYALYRVTFEDLSKPFANNTYASSIWYYYTPATASYSKQLSQVGGWWGDLVDNAPPSGSIEGTYSTSVTVNWRSGISYVNASCTTMTQMTLEYLVPFGILAG